MDSSSSSDKAAHALASPLHPLTPTSESTSTSQISSTHTPTTSTASSTPLTSSPASGESLTGFDFTHTHDYCRDDSDGSSDSFRPVGVAFPSKDSSTIVGSCGTGDYSPTEEDMVLDSSDQDVVGGVRSEEEGFTSPDDIRDAVDLEFSTTEEEEDGTRRDHTPSLPSSSSSPVESVLAPAVNVVAGRISSVPIELTVATATRHNEKESLIQSPGVSLPSQPAGETPASPTGKLLIHDGSTAVQFSRESESHEYAVSDKERDQTDAHSSNPFITSSYKSRGVTRPPLTRNRRFVEDSDSAKELTSLNISHEVARSAPSLSEDAFPVCPDTAEIKGENTDRIVSSSSLSSSSSVRSKRHRRRGLGHSLSFNLEDVTSDVNREYPSGHHHHPQLRQQRSLDETQARKKSFVVLSLDEGISNSQVDSWDHGDLEDNPLESMKIDNDKWKVGNVLGCPKSSPLPYRLESDSHSVNIVDEDPKRKGMKMSSDSDTCHDNNSNIKKGLKVKSVLYRVKEEAHHEVLDEEVNKSPRGKKTKDLGHENPGFLDDEQDIVSREENTSDQSPQDDESTVDVTRRMSNPECSVLKSEDIIRSHSYDNELNKVMNNLNGEEGQTVVAPTLRKRSLSRGRPEKPDDMQNSSSHAEESSPSSSKKDSHFVSFGPTFSYGGDESATSSIFQKLVTNPIMRLTRSESTKSHMAVKSGSKDGLARSSSSIWEGGLKSKGGGSSGNSSYYGRPPQAPSSLAQRDDHRHTHKSYILHQHLYRNSRRNMQQKLLRQLSDVYHEDHRYGSNYDSHHSGRHDSTHKKHDSHHPEHGRHYDSPSTPPDLRHHPLLHQHGHGHHHRSQSQRHLHRPKHEPLRRLNTYGHEEYHKYVKEHELRYEQEMAQREQARIPSQEHLHSQQREGEGYEVELKPPLQEGREAIRRISHYQQEEKGKTDVERWVGVHGDQPAEGTPAQPLLPSPGTPHIVVSPGDSNKSGQPTQRDAENQLNPPGNNGPVFPNAQSTPAPPPTPANNVEEKKSRPEKLALSMTTLDLPDGRHPSVDGMYRKTRRNSVSEMHRRYGSQSNLQRSSSVNNVQRSNSRNSLDPSVLDWKQEGYDSLIACLSALYGKLLVVMGMAFPTAEVISHDIPVTFYNGFYLYLYIGSIIFLVYAYLFLLHSINIPTEQLKSKFQSIRSLLTIPDISMVLPTRNTSKQEGNIASRESRISGFSDADKESDRVSINTGSFKTPRYTLTESNNHGSMYLKMGAVLFGIGSMIYSGLEVGQYFELKSDENCADILLAISPAARMLFTFIQMYFIFLNSRVAISRHRVIARFGLMHMIGTNLCIWLNVLVQETKHEIINLTLGPDAHHGGGNLWAQIINGDFSVSAHHGATGSGHHSDSVAVLGHHAETHNNTYGSNHTDPSMFNDTMHGHGSHSLPDIHEVSNHSSSHHVVRRSANHQALSIYECRRSDLMGELVDEASPFLFPCTIEYSLLCAGVLYVIWKNINKPEVAYDGDSDISTYIARKARHHYSVDCAHANRGLFMGILVLVLTIISLILFFVLINNEAYKEVAILEANIIELSVYGVASVTVIIGMIQMRELEFIPEGDIELDNILLLIAQSGVYIYTSFTVIGGHFTMTDNLILPLLSAIITLLQTTLQTIFILDASRRCCYNQDQLERKPGREMVTFLLVCNLAMWAINTFETSRADAHPTQLNFYGIWAWTIISHISMPLAIFYRFHVTVCLCEIWKRSYKLRNDY